ncbi:alpha/beta hydrolase [Ekhidna sp.]|uniref:alpha/beta hydrolase n=1 Tax=Ekhidna sp. TaxID=2608089 RepID=UPI003512C0B3
MTKIELPDGQLYYSKYGEGSQILIAFHGFGQDSKIFKEWTKNYGSVYTIYAFDIFYHGKSHRSKSTLTKKQWASYLLEFLQKEGVDNFSVLGYSLGGRFAIASAMILPKQVDEVILIAPDGIYLSIWFKLATSPWIRWLFKYFMLNPEKLERLIELNDKYKIASPYMGDFVRKELGEADNRKRVYISWNHFKTLGYSKRQLINAFNKHSFKKRIILGEKDHIIKPVKILPIIRKMGDFRIDTFPLKHHQLIKPEVAKLILEKK